MSPFSCVREREVTELMDQGFWPEACPVDLRAHVESCRMCSDLVLVSQAFQAAHKQTAQLPHLESAGAVWWRAQLRRRNAAIEKVGRPILGAQIFALVMSLVVAAAVVAWRGATLKAWIAEPAASSAHGRTYTDRLFSVQRDGIDCASGTGNRGVAKRGGDLPGDGKAIDWLHIQVCGLLGGLQHSIPRYASQSRATR